MAWTAPKTWADGNIPDADDLNTHIKDNLNALSTHDHGGAAGDGAAALGDLNSLTFVNQGSTPTAPGSTKLVAFSESETFKIRAGASGAATAVSLVGHTHTLTESQNTTSTGTNVGGAATIAVSEVAIGTSLASAMGTNSITPTTAKTAVIASYVFYCIYKSGSGTTTITWSAKSDTVQYDTGTFTVANGGNTTHAFTTMLIDSAASSHDLTLDVQASQVGVSFCTPVSTASFAEVSL